MFKTAIGQDSHRFEKNNSNKPLKLGGIVIPGCRGLEGNSDADVVLHALTNAISGISGENILGKISDEMCLTQGIKDSSVYLTRALQGIGIYRITHISISIEAKIPILSPHIAAMKESIARLVGLQPSDVGITATSGENLTAFGRGKGIAALALVSAIADCQKNSQKGPVRKKLRTKSKAF